MLVRDCGVLRFFRRQMAVVVGTKSHYEALGVTPKATQGDIKAAYYKLSMLYHPDKNKGSEDAAKKFRSINSAYEVLGNVRLRKLYDKGMMVGDPSSHSPSSHASSYSSPSSARRQSTFYQSRQTRSRPPPPDGFTPIYDFDEWSRSHYGATFARDMANKRRQKNREERFEQQLNDVKMQRILFVLGVMVAFFLYITQQDYDQVVKYGETYTNGQNTVVETERAVPSTIDESKT